MPENTPELIQHLEPVLEAQVSCSTLIVNSSWFSQPPCTTPLPAGSASVFQRA